MTKALVFNPVIGIQVGLWVSVIAVSVYLLRRRRVTSTIRVGFLVGGVIVFGFVIGLLLSSAPPNPISALRSFLTGLLVRGRVIPVVAAMLAVLLFLVWLSNKSICGWGCPLGLLQDLLHRVPLPKWKVPFWLSNGVRGLAFLALLTGLVTAGLDWIGVIDPFSIFSLSLAGGAAGLVGLLLLASLVFYRPWCQFLCPFGFVGWVVEQVSLLRPRIDRDLCLGCQRCVAACPTQAMADHYAGKKLHADCFACGACLNACPKEGALEWRTRASLHRHSREGKAK
jgi:polyferredoxin